MVRKLTLAMVVALLAAAAFGAYRYQSFLALPLSVPERGQVWILQRGTSYRGMVRQLADLGLTQRYWEWRVLGLLDPRAGRLQAGEYLLEPGLTPDGLLNKLADGDVLLHGFTIVEGWTVRDLRNSLAEHPVVVQTIGGLSDEDMMQRLSTEYDHPEGLFLPETYRFPRGTTDLAILQWAHDAMQTTLAEVWAERDMGLPLDEPYQALILASIIEKETAVAEERTRIAGVFVRRLERGMRLQTDPTVIYGLGAAFDGNLRRRDLRADTAYNTYTRRGLPPTPIALPGRASLEAAVHPAAGDALYFVARGDGSHHFSSSLEEHERAVDRYQRNRN